MQPTSNRVIQIESNKPGTIADICKVHEGEQILIWTQFDEEGDILAAWLPGSVHLTGKMKQEKRLQVLEDFRRGIVRILLVKPRLMGSGLNLQFCSVCIFSWSADSWEAFYQAVGRIHRYGQKKRVKIYIPYTDLEKPMLQNVMRKKADYMEDAAFQEKLYIESLMDDLKELAHVELTDDDSAKEFIPTIYGEDYTLIHGDCIEEMAKMQENQFELAVFSPPFADLYSYSSDDMDLGNCNSLDDEFELHFSFFAHNLYRVMKPGCVVAMHIAPLAILKQVKGYTGIRDFPSECRAVFESVGFVYDGKATIGKNPQALRDGTGVLTPVGWRDIDKLCVEDYVVGGDGKPVKVLGVFHHPDREIYRVTFSDGATIDCDGQHLWTVQTYGQRNYNWMLKTTMELAQLGSERGSGCPKYRIPVVSNPIEFTQNTPLLIDPYFMGVLLGDGSVSQHGAVEFTVETEIMDNLSIPPDHECVLRKNSQRKGGEVNTYAIKCGEWHRNDVVAALRLYGVQGKRAWEKSIPEDFLFASVDDRWALLQGLLDTDGSIDQRGFRVKFNTTSPYLAHDIIAFLVESLGGLAHLKLNEGSMYRHKGESRHGRPIYDITIRIKGNCPFRISRKASLWGANRKEYRRSIKNIKILADRSDCTCITVDAPDGLFVTKGCVVTHNSQSIRTHAQGLAFKTLHSDSRKMRFAIPDYLMKFMKPGEAPKFSNADVTNEDWIRMASPIWDWVNETKTLNAQTKQLSEGDVKHICPLQTPVIDAAVRLWSERGEHVLSPFCGIGSEGVISLRLGRKFTGIELKRQYIQLAHQNILHETKTKGQQLNAFHNMQRAKNGQ